MSFNCFYFKYTDVFVSYHWPNFNASGDEAYCEPNDFTINASQPEFKFYIKIKNCLFLIKQYEYKPLITIQIIKYL